MRETIYLRVNRRKVEQLNLDAESITTIRLTQLINGVSEELVK